MGGFTFCCGDMGPVMEAKGTVTNEILEMIEDDPRVCYINADGTGRGGRVQQAQLRYPDRILDVGIQEMNMVTIAAGLAKEGFLPYVQTFGPFLCVRALDQIHNDVAYNDYPVRLIGTHAGLSSGYGPTHNTIIEFGVMNSLPNMTMVAPCDAEQCKKLLRKSLNYPKPIYIRIPRGEEPLVYAADHDYDYEIGKAIVIQEGTDLNFIATGMGVYNCVQAARQLEEKGYSVGVIDMHTIKPIDKDAVVHAAKLSGNIITVEDHNILGGLGSIVADTLEVEGVEIACVSGSFPSSQALIEVKVAETALAVKDGATEIDIVMPVGKFLCGDYQSCAEDITELKAACGDAAMKVILETGDLVTASNIKKASILSMYAGADYIKTSTGKEKISATPEAAYVMCQAIKEYYDQTGIQIGFKPAGGINSVMDAITYYTIVKEVLGEQWLTNKWFRLGTSRLANQLLSELEGQEVKFFEAKGPEGR